MNMLPLSSTANGDDILRFVVAIDAGQVTAFISSATCQSHHAWQDGRQTLARFCQDHRGLLDAIVTRKVLAGARHPVVVMASDLQT
jgi:hypothetical protein